MHELLTLRFFYSLEVYEMVAGSWELNPVQNAYETFPDSRPATRCKSGGRCGSRTHL